jgi:hypothetical protein
MLGSAGIGPAPIDTESLGNSASWLGEEANHPTELQSDYSPVGPERKTDRP